MQFADCPDVRVATPEDEDALMDMMKLAHEEAGEHPMSEPKVRLTIHNGVHRRGGMIAVIGEAGAPLKASLVLCLSPVWYSDEYQLLELTNFVHPDHRRSNFAKQMIAFAKHCSQSLDLDLMIGVFSNERTEAKVRLYARQLPKRGEFFCFRPHA